MNNKRKIIVPGVSYVILSLFLILFAACTPSLEKKIIGKWNETDGSEKIEFFKDGTIIISENSLNMSGKYLFLDKNRIKIELSGIGMLAGAQTCTIEIINEQLTVTDSSGKTTVYRRE